MSKGRSAEVPSGPQRLGLGQNFHITPNFLRSRRRPGPRAALDTGRILSSGRPKSRTRGRYDEGVGVGTICSISSSRGRERRIYDRGRRMHDFKPDGWPTVTPRIFTHDVAGLVGFLKAVFDAGGECRVGMPAEIRIGDSIMMISDSGGRRETMTAFLYVYVKDADETYRLALDNGAEPVEKLMDTPYGDRRATVIDSWGNTWQIATHKSI
jgi:PhnB protein